MAFLGKMVRRFSRLQTEGNDWCTKTTKTYYKYALELSQLALAKPHLEPYAKPWEALFKKFLNQRKAAKMIKDSQKIWLLGLKRCLFSLGKEKLRRDVRILLKYIETAAEMLETNCSSVSGVSAGNSGQTQGKISQL